MFKQPGHYFFSISFQWKDIFKILEVPEKEQVDFVIEEKYRYQSPNANSTDGLGINSTSAVFEYYIIPNSLRSEKYSYSSIYDQQLKRFFESPNINYGAVLKNSKKEESSLICFFNKNLVKNKAAFSIFFANEGRWKTIVFLFDEIYLNLEDAHNRWGEKIPFESIEISSNDKGDNIVNKVLVSPEVIWINMNVQSQDDAQASPFGHDLYKYFNK